MAVVLRPTFHETLCRALGLDPARCRRITLVSEYDALVEAHVILEAGQAKRVADLAAQIPPGQVIVEEEA